jgi:hypothetical protein
MFVLLDDPLDSLDDILTDPLRIALCGLTARISGLTVPPGCLPLLSWTRHDRPPMLPRTTTTDLASRLVWFNQPEPSPFVSTSLSSKRAPCSKIRAPLLELGNNYELLINCLSLPLLLRPPPPWRLLLFWFENTTNPSRTPPTKEPLNSYLR